MKKFINKNKWSICVLIFFIIFIIISYIFKFTFSKKVMNNFMMFLVELFSFIPLMCILIGIFDVWFPKKIVEKHIGKDSGVKGIFWVILLAMFQAGPLYGAFPVAYILWKKGGRIRNVFIYLGAFASLKLPMLTFETGFLGLKFTLLRTLLTLPLFILIGIIMEVYLKNKDFKINQP